MTSVGGGDDGCVVSVGFGVGVSANGGSEVGMAVELAEETGVEVASASAVAVDRAEGLFPIPPPPLPQAIVSSASVIAGIAKNLF